MTMVAACRFRDEAVIIADSRITWDSSRARILSDTAKKILPLGSKLVVAFAGNVDVVEKIISQLRKQTAKHPRLRIPRKLAAYLPRVARYVHQSYSGKKYYKCSVELVFAGVDISGKVSLWIYKSPLFKPMEVKEGFVIIGSGSIVKPYLMENYQRFISSSENLKNFADRLISGLSAELKKTGVVTVGGLFQVILLSSQGISPLKHGFIELTPADLGDAKYMDVKGGKWVQIDSVKKTEVELAEPAIILTKSAKERRFHDYEMLEMDNKPLRWYLSYFATCLKVERDPDRIMFEAPISQIGSFRYPRHLPILTSVGFWGPAGTRELSFCLDVEGEIKTIHKESINIEYFPEQVEIDRVLSFDICSQGTVFLECYIDDQLLARKALYFGKFSKPTSETEEWRENFIKDYPRILVEEHRICTDPMIQKFGCFLEYFTVCQEVSLKEGKTHFIGEMRSVYSKSYPLLLKLFFACALRFSKGKHNIHIDLIDADTHENKKVASTVITATADCIAIPINGELIVSIPKPGFYLFNLYVDDQFISSIVLPVETDEPQYSYSLMDQDLKLVQSGKVFYLAKRSQQAR